MSASVTRRFLLPLGIILAGILITVILVKTRPHAERRPSQRPRPLVEAVTVSEGSQTVEVRGFGTVRAKRKVNVTPQVNGEIVMKSPAFEPGGSFTAGDVLLRIDDTDYALAAAQAEANVAQAEYNLAMAEEEAQVARDAWERVGDGEASGLVLHEPQLRLAKANLASAQAALRQANVNLDRCTITAPFDGAVLSADADEGQYLRAGNAIGSIHATGVAEITVPVADSEIGWVELAGDTQTGSEVAVHAEFADQAHVWTGRAARLGGAIDERSRLVPVVVEIDNPFTATDGRPALIEGMFVEAVFSAPPAAGSIVIPRSAVRPGDVVWVIDGEGNIDIRPVGISHTGVDRTVIESGLTIGERICTSNLQYVTRGMPVRVVGDPEPEAPSSGTPAGAAGTASQGGER